MNQLKMYRLKGNLPEALTLPEGYSFSRYSSPSDIGDWLRCCRNGLVSDDANDSVFNQCILNEKDVRADKDLFFLDYRGEHIGTITAIHHPDGNFGEVHMVAIREDFRGKGLGKYLNNAALRHLLPLGVHHIFLTTDDWRKSAIRSYLAAGFLPVDCGDDMQERWTALLTEFDIPSVDMLDTNGNYSCTLHSLKGT